MANEVALFVKAFEEWDRRWREKPDEFMDVVTHLLKETPQSYGEAAAVYFVNLCAELSND